MWRLSPQQMWRFSQWLASGISFSWLLCPLNMSQSFFKHLLTFWHKKIFQTHLVSVLSLESAIPGPFSKERQLETSVRCSMCSLLLGCYYFCRLSADRARICLCIYIIPPTHIYNYICVHLYLYISSISMYIDLYFMLIYIFKNNEFILYFQLQSNTSSSFSTFPFHFLSSLQPGSHCPLYTYSLAQVTYLLSVTHSKLITASMWTPPSATPVQLSPQTPRSPERGKEGRESLKAVSKKNMEKITLLEASYRM